MAYGKSIKKNFYSNGGGNIEMPPLNEVPPVLADSPELIGSLKQEQEAEVSIVDSSEQVDVGTGQQESNDNASNGVETQEEAEAVLQQKPKVNTVAENLKALREARERAEWERDTLKQQMAEIQRSLQQQYQPQQKQVEAPVEEPDDFNFDVADDSLLEGKDAKKIINELKKVKKELRQFHSQSSGMAVEAKIKSNFPDFEEVVSVDNVAILNQQFPEIAQSLRDTQDLYSKASAAYSIMKRFGIHKDKDFDEDKMKAIKNAQKPRPVASVNPQQGESPLTKANAFENGLSKELQKKLLEEMAQARRRM